MGQLTTRFSCWFSSLAGWVREFCFVSEPSACSWSRGNLPSPVRTLAKDLLLLLRAQRNSPFPTRPRPTASRNFYMNTNAFFGIPYDFFAWLLSLLLHTGSYLLLTLGVFQIWRRTRYWALPLLATSFLLTGIVTALRLLIANQPEAQPLSGVLQSTYEQIKSALDMVRTGLLFVGALGLLAAASRFRLVASQAAGRDPAPETVCPTPML